MRLQNRVSYALRIGARRETRTVAQRGTGRGFRNRQIATTVFSLSDFFLRVLGADVEGVVPGRLRQIALPLFRRPPLEFSAISEDVSFSLGVKEDVGTLLFLRVLELDDPHCRVGYGAWLE
ncbi:hypothetical protein GWI33_010699, partial [Rhynchophorus ferrugineus]